MLGREVLGREGRDSVWGTVLPLLRGTDAVIADLECAITFHTGDWASTENVHHFRAEPPVAVEVLRAANVRCVSLANDHILDFGEQGLFDTVENLHAAGIATAGAGRNDSQAASPALLQLRDLVVAVVALADTDPSFAATHRAAGVNTVDVECAPPPGIELARLAASCREAGADLAVLSMHWAPRLTAEPTPAVRDFAHAAIESGFDVFFGHASHVFHGIEVYRERPIFYDTGDFLHDYAVDGAVRRDCSFVFLVDVVEKRPRRVQLIPVRLTFARVDLASGEEAGAICQRMLERSRAFGTALTEVGGTLEIADCRGRTTHSGTRGAPASRVATA